MQESRAHLLAVRLDDLPEPLDDVRVGRAVLQPGVLLPVADVDRPEAADHELELALVEGPQQLGRYELVEALLEGEKLLLDAAHEAVIDVEPHVLFLVLLGHRDVLAAGLELVVLEDAEAAVLDHEGRVQHAVYAVLPGESELNVVRIDSCFLFVGWVSLGKIEMKFVHR